MRWASYLHFHPKPGSGFEHRQQDQNLQPASATAHFKQQRANPALPPLPAPSAWPACVHRMNS